MNAVGYMPMPEKFRYRDVFLLGKPQHARNDRFSIKAQAFFGSYLDKNNHHFEKLGLENLTGVNLGVEFPSEQQRPWQQYLNNSTLGVGLSIIDWNSTYMGKAVAMYPYLLIPAVRNQRFQFNVKIAAGLGVVSETWKTQEIHDPDRYFDDNAMTNNVFGCYLNAYLSAADATENRGLHPSFGGNFPSGQHLTLSVYSAHFG